jgi:copper chaperone CopZ
MKETLAGVGAVLMASLASICCLGPLVLASLGLGGLGSSAGLIEYRPVFLGITAVLLGMAFFLTYRRREVKCADGLCEFRSGSRTMKVALWGITASVVALATFSHHGGSLSGNAQVRANPTGQQITLSIRGMTCAACATGIERALRKVPDVQSASVSLDKQEAVVVVKPGRVQTDHLIQAVESVGPFRARPARSE